jgi:hypothetical protein
MIGFRDQKKKKRYKMTELRQTKGERDTEIEKVGIKKL